MWGFVLLRDTSEQIDTLRRTEDYALGSACKPGRRSPQGLDATVYEEILARNMNFHDETIEGL